jgi:hypothetical protein
MGRPDFLAEFTQDRAQSVRTNFHSQRVRSINNIKYRNYICKDELLFKAYHEKIRVRAPILISMDCLRHAD